ncbi:MAG: ubiquinol-cytochrome c reductase iron-sulfur subunit [Terracidiphilus sp.]
MTHDDHPPENPNATSPVEAAPPEDPGVVSRRWLLLKASIALNGLVGVVLAVPVLRYLFSPAKSGSSFKSWVSLGAADSFPAGQTRLAYYKNPYSRPWDGQTDNTACYVRHIGAKQFEVFAVNCAHLDCPVRWFPESQLFMCPCHGGIYYADGSRAAGPPPRGLFKYAWKLVGSDLHIYAGQMPTLSTSAKLVNISPATSTDKGDCPCRG